MNQLAEFFQRDNSVISRHIKNIFDEGVLAHEATVAKFATVQIEEAKTVQRQIEFYNLYVIISVGYQVKSNRGTRFRIRDIRSAEKVFWCKMLDIYATSREKELTTLTVKGVFSSKIKEIGV